MYVFIYYYFFDNFKFFDLKKNSKRNIRAGLLALHKNTYIQMNRWIDGWIDGSIDRKIDGQIDRQMDRCIHGQMDIWMDRQIGRQMDGQKD